MFTAYMNGQLFLDTGGQQRGLGLTKANLSLEVGKAGSFTFTVPPTNVLYDDFQKFTSYVDLYKKDRLIFSGRVLETRKNLYNLQEVVCEGLLAIFNDSVSRPFTHSGTLNALLQNLLNNHNSQVGADKKVSLGTVTVTDSNNYVGREYEAYVSTMKRLEELAAAMGGYFVIRKTENGILLDYLEDFTETSSQKINFGENLLDIDRESSGVDMVTALLPLGAMDEETGEKLTVKAVNNGLDYIVEQVAMETYGWILGIKEWPDVTTPTALKNKAMAYLDDKCKDRITINVTAVDMETANSDILGFHCGEYIKVESALHSVNEYMLAKKQEINLFSPANNKMTLGTTRLGYIDNSNKIESDLVNVIQKTQQSVSNATQKTVTLESKLEVQADKIESMVSEITEMGGKVTENQTLAQQTADKFTWLVSSGTDATNFTLTSRVASLLSDEFDITALTTFRSNAMSGDITVINGGAIETNSILVDRLVAGTLDGFVLSQGGRTGINDTEHPTGSYFGKDGFALGSALKYDAEADTITISGGTTLTWDDIEGVPDDLVYSEDISGFVTSSQATTIAQNAIATATIYANQIYAVDIAASSSTDARISVSYGSYYAEMCAGMVQVGTFGGGGTQIEAGGITTGWVDADKWIYNGTSYTPYSFADAYHSHDEYYVNGNTVYANYLYISRLGSASQQALYCSTNSGIVGTDSSSMRYKNSIADVTDEMLDPKRLYNLPVRQFKWNEGHFDEAENYNYDTVNIGFIAEEMAEFYPYATVISKGQIESWEARRILPAMLALIQDQKKMIDNLSERIERLES